MKLPKKPKKSSKQKLEHKQTAWAVRQDYKDVDGSWHSGLLGRYYFYPHNPAPQHEGCRIALFKTRAEARERIKEHKRGRDHLAGDVFTPVKVEIQIKEL